MAKKHIRYFARQLVDLYSESEKILADVGLATQDIMFSPEEQKLFSTYKSAVDNELSLLSVALSSAAQGKIMSLINSVKKQETTFLDSLNGLLDNLANPDFPVDQVEPTKQLVSTYTAQLKGISSTLLTLQAVYEWAKFPASIKKQKKSTSFYDRGVSLSERLLDMYSDSSMFSSAKRALVQFQDYVNSLQASVTEAGPVDDLSE